MLAFCTALTPAVLVSGCQLPVLGPGYYAACAVGGAVACGLTHTLITPLDLVKCNKQANPALFSRSALSGLTAVYGGALSSAGFGSGLRALFRGWGPTCVGYSLQGAIKFGLYELIKSQSLVRLEPEQAVARRDAVCLAAAASAELLADVALCPLEAVKVRVQTEPTFARGLTVSSDSTWAAAALCSLTLLPRPALLPLRTVCLGCCARAACGICTAASCLWSCARCRTR